MWDESGRERGRSCAYACAVQLAKEAGVPDGVLNVIHGAHDAVNFICDEPRAPRTSRRDYYYY